MILIWFIRNVFTFWKQLWRIDQIIQWNLQKSKSAPVTLFDLYFWPDKKSNICTHNALTWPAQLLNILRMKHSHICGLLLVYDYNALFSCGCKKACLNADLFRFSLDWFIFMAHCRLNSFLFPWHQVFFQGKFCEMTTCPVGLGRDQKTE